MKRAGGVDNGSQGFWGESRDSPLFDCLIEAL